MNASGAQMGLRRYLVAGVLVWLPILATIWVVSFMLQLMDRTLLLAAARLPARGAGRLRAARGGLRVRAGRVLPHGAAGHEPRRAAADRLGRGAPEPHPVVRTVYGGVKSFAESVLSQSNSFRKVVMIEYPRAGVWSIGFLTAEDVPEVSAKLGEPQSAVYISAALNATAGYLVIVPRRQVVELDMSVDAAMKMIITCGVVVPPAPKPPKVREPATAD